MANKNKESINENIVKYTEYFKEDLEAIEEELKKSKEYSSFIDTEISKLTAPSLGSNRGGQHYLIQHITNAVQLQTQRQGLRRDRFAIKKAIMDYSAKFAEEKQTSGENDLTEAINRLISSSIKDKNEKEVIKNEENLDDIIDAALNDEGKK